MDAQRRARQMAGMPHYYFNLFDDDVTIADEGLPFDDDAAAMEHAVAEARAIAADAVLQGRFVGSHYIEVREERRGVVGRVRFDEAVEVN